MSTHDRANTDVTSGQGAFSLLPGLLLCLGVAAGAYALGLFYPIVGGPVFAIVLGLLISALRRPEARFRPGTGYASKQLLQVAIILMGFGLRIDEVFSVGRESVLVMLSTLVVCLVAARAFGKLLGVSDNLTALVGAGTGICGASAIAAVTSAIQAEESEVAYSVSTIFAFNLVAVLLFPALGHAMGFDQKAFGLWAGTAINDTSSVVAAAYAYGADAGAYATVVKLARSTMIIPISLLAAAWSSARNRSGSAVQWGRIVPWFILWFLGAALIRSVGLVPALAAEWLPLVGRGLMVAALAAVGLNADLRAVARTGWRPLLLGAILWVLVTLTSLLVQHLTGL